MQPLFVVLVHDEGCLPFASSAKALLDLRMVVARGRDFYCILVASHGSAATAPRGKQQQQKQHAAMHSSSSGMAMRSEP